MEGLFEGLDDRPEARQLVSHKSIIVNEKIIRVGGPAERHTVQWSIWLNIVPAGRSFGTWRNRPWKRRFMAEAPGTVDGAKDTH